MQHLKHRRGGFTLVEILVVLAVIAIISAISFGAFRSIREGNQRTSCQTNLSQIYKSFRLYSQDYDGRFPYLNSDGASNAVQTPQGGIGLWSLYAYPAPTALCTSTYDDYDTDLNLPLVSDDGNQLAGYVRSSKIFHCPADRFDKAIQLRTSTTACTTLTAPTASFSLKQNNVSYINSAFLSYQTKDDTGPVSRDTYSSFRAAGSATRQLTPYVVLGGVNQVLQRPTRDITVVTWCRFHRALSNVGVTTSGKRNFDNVLFSDGTVQILPADQAVTDKSPGTGTGTCSGWQRVPRDRAETMSTSATCTP